MKKGGQYGRLAALLLFWFGVSDRASAAEQATESRRTDVDPRNPTHAASALLCGWRREPARWFLAGRADLGFQFFRPRAEFGYGRPHEHWVGVDVVPILSTTQAGVYSGMRYRHPRFEVRTGGLFSYAFSRAYLEPLDSYDQNDLELRGGKNANYGASDSELTLSIPLGRALLGSETQALLVFGVPDDRYVFVHPMGAVIEPPWVFRQRISLGYPVPGVPGFFIAPAGEVVVTPERADPWVIRAGAIFSLSMYQDVDLVTELLPTIKSPDTLGRAGAPWFQITLRVRWATN